jgi:hypothetical protein
MAGIGMATARGVARIKNSECLTYLKARAAMGGAS